MGSFHEYIHEYKQQLAKGSIQKAYKGLMEYIMTLRTDLSSRYPDYFVSGSIYAGTMDMTYFSFSPQSLVQRKLKIAIVFNYGDFRFEAWLSGANKQVQFQFWKIIKDSGWSQYRIVPGIQGFDSIIETVLVDDPDFQDLNALTQQIERRTLTFIEDIEHFLAQQN